MHVAVAIVGFRNVDDVVRCVTSLEQSTHGDFEVVICENGGAAAHADLQAALPNVLQGGQAVSLILSPENRGFAAGVNTCLRASPGADAWWVLNPDTRPRPEALARLVERLVRGDCDAVGGTLYRVDGKIQSHGGRWRPSLARAESIGHGTALGDPVDAAYVERTQDFLMGASMLIGRRFYLEVGPMREDYFLYCEEVEWFLRARARGMRLGFASSALVLHDQGSTTGSGQDPRQRPRMPIFLDERNKVLVTRDCFRARLPIAAAAAFALVCARYGRCGAWRQLAYGLSGWYDGLRNRRGPPRAATA
jgi:GT2 family glycosyltransferase